jgi:ComF family protein
MSLIESLFNLFAVHECVGCRAEGSLLCPRCALRLTRIVPRCYRCKRWSDAFITCQACRKHTPLASLRVVTPYEGQAKEVLHRLKFERARAAAATIAGLLPALPTDKDALITYVPTASERVRQRGYDQSALIARQLARQLGVPCFPLLARIGSQRQVGQQRQIRKKQMKGAFRPVNTALLQQQRVLLIDDVLTTGATCEAAARVLKQAGAKQVDAAVFAVA